jgi:ABC-type tungstate transport system substrate-binding protein
MSYTCIIKHAGIQLRTKVVYTYIQTETFCGEFSSEIKLHIYCFTVTFLFICCVKTLFFVTSFRLAQSTRVQF